MEKLMRTILVALFVMMTSFGFSGEAVTPEGIEAIKEKIISHEALKEKLAELENRPPHLREE